jgi:hypothetical protein
MNGEKLISLFEEAKEKANVVLGFDEIDINERTDESRQLICFVSKELNEYLYVANVETIDFEVGDYLESNGYYQLVKILDVLNYF